MWRLLLAIKKNLVWIIPCAMGLGLLFGYLYDSLWLKKTVIPLTILMIFPIMATIDIRSVFMKCSFKVQIITKLINFIAIPLIGVVVGKIFLRDYPILAFGLLLIALLPTSSMTVSWTGFAKGNVNVAVKMSIIGLLVGPLLAPIYAKIFMGNVIVMPLSKIFRQMSIIILIPMLLGYFTRLVLINKYGENRFNTEIKAKFPLLATVGVIGIIFIAIALKANVIINNPQVVLISFLPLLVFYGINYAVVTVLAKKMFIASDSIALVYGTVMRNLSVALAVVLTVLGKEGPQAALIIALAYLIQVKSAAWYGKYVEHIFGKQEKLGAVSL